jgi:hypothetical protein
MSFDFACNTGQTAIPQLTTIVAALKFVLIIADLAGYPLLILFQKFLCRFNLS